MSTHTKRARKPKWLAASLATLSTALILNLGAAKLLVKSKPDVSDALLPHYSEALIKLNQNDIAAGTGIDTSVIRQRSVKILNRAPLSAHPFLFEAVAQSEINSTSSLVLEEAQRRDRRNIPLAKLLLRSYAVSGQGEKTAEQLLLLIRIDPYKAHNYIPLLAELSFERSTSDIVDAAINQKPSWLPAYMRDLLKEDRPAYRGKRDIKFTELESLLSNKSQYQDIADQFISRQIEAKSFNQAFAFFQRVFPAYTADAPNVITDPGFTGRMGENPITWKVLNTKRNSVSWNNGGGAEVYSIAKNTSPILYKTLKLQPGQRLGLSMEYEWPYKQKSGEFLWALSCAEDGQSYFTWPLSPNTENITHRFKLDASCQYYDLTLRVDPGLSAEPARVRLNALTLTPVTD